MPCFGVLIFGDNALIFKEPDTIKTDDKFVQAGLDAEKQMAFYLRRAFGDDPNVSVLNGIRLEFDGDSAQIDHLIIHKYGMIIIESKSITGKVTINERGEWSRQFKFSQGMPSPVKQAERQRDFLKKYLGALGPELPKDMGIQRTFNKLPFNVLVAISDAGIIQQPSKARLDNVCKADLIPDKINEIIRGYQKEKGFLSLSFRPFVLSDNIREEICQFLIKSHSPFVPQILKNNVPVPLAQPNRQTYTHAYFHCRKCNSTKLNIIGGKYGYYFKCDECKENTPIKQICPKCNIKMKLRKEKNKFYTECTSCGETNLFYTNPH